MMNYRDILKKLSLLFAAMVFIMFSFVNQNFTHQHILSDGSLIEHSHPYSSQSENQHQHEDGEIYFLASTNSLIDIVEILPDFSIHTQTILKTTPLPNVELIELMIFPLNILRGPPSC